MKKQAIRRKKRKMKIRKTIFGTKSVPRVSIFKSNKRFGAQAIVDTDHITIAAIDTDKNNVEGVAKIAEKFAKDLKKEKVDSIKFDRNGFKFHGRVKTFADKLRENGINF